MLPEPSSIHPPEHIPNIPVSKGSPPAESEAADTPAVAEAAPARIPWAEDRTKPRCNPRPGLPSYLSNCLPEAQQPVQKLDLDPPVTIAEAHSTASLPVLKSPFRLQEPDSHSRDRSDLDRLGRKSSKLFAYSRRLLGPGTSCNPPRLKEGRAQRLNMSKIVLSIS